MIITVAHQKGGVGKSTVAANLAVAYIDKIGERLRVIDLDMQRSLSYWNQLRAQGGAASLRIDSVGSAAELKKMINAHDDRDVLLIDVGGFDSDLNRIALLGADRIVTPVSDSGIELAGLLNFRAILRELREIRPDLTATVLLNRVHPFATRSLEGIFTFAREQVEYDIFFAILRDRGEYRRAFDAGLGVMETEPTGKAASEIKNLIGEINGKNQ